MKKKRFFGNTLIAQRSATLVAVFVALIIALAAIIPLSYGWFAESKHATANGMQVQVNTGNFEVFYRIGNTGTYIEMPIMGTSADFFDDIRAPGDSVDIYVKIKNNEQFAVKLTGFGFEAPDESGERPITGTDHYLSTELYAELMTVQISNKSPVPFDDDATDCYFRANDNAGRIDWIEAINTAAGEVEIQPNETVELCMRVTFKNADYDQNVFKNFTQNGGKFARSIFFTYACLEDEI